MKIDNFKVYDLEESVVASGLPMKAVYNAQEFCFDKDDVRKSELITDTNDGMRAVKLAKNEPGTGHNNFLSGILVAANVTATNVWWLQMERYHFVQIVSMQSKMHRLREMIGNKRIEDGGKFPFFGGRADIFRAFYEEAINGTSDDEGLVMQCPMGLQLTGRITTNYLALKTIWNQRHNHKLSEWHEFCDWIKELPFAEDLILRKAKNEA